MSGDVVMMRRKLGQFQIKVWLPDGARYETFTERNLSLQEFVQTLDGAIASLCRLRDHAKGSETDTGEPA